MKKQFEKAKELKLSSSTIQRYRGEINMPSTYRIQTSSNTIKERTPNINLDDVKMTSNDLKMTSNDLKMTSKEFSHQTFKPTKNKLKEDADIRSNDKNFDEIFRNNL